MIIFVALVGVKQSMYFKFMSTTGIEITAKNNTDDNTANNHSEKNI